jgi:hypothetical protein
VGSSPTGLTLPKRSVTIANYIPNVYNFGFVSEKEHPYIRHYHEGQLVSVNYLCASILGLPHGLTLEEAKAIGPNLNDSTGYHLKHPLPDRIPTTEMRTTPEKEVKKISSTPITVEFDLEAADDLEQAV